MEIREKQKSNVLKTCFLKLTVGQSDEFKTDIKNALRWSKHVWFNKFHGRTELTEAETIVIEMIFERDYNK